MGGFLVNVFVRCDEQKAVTDAAKAVFAPLHPGTTAADSLRAKLKASLAPEVAARFSSLLAQSGLSKPEQPACFISHSNGGWVGVHDEAMQSQDEALCSQIARELSQRLDTTAIAFLIHDGDFLCYWLARQGELLDAYNSMPGYFDEEAEATGPSGGDPTQLAEACGRPDVQAELSAVLAEPDSDAFNQLAQLGSLLGIPDPHIDYNLLTYVPPQLPPGVTIPVPEPEIPHRDEYVALTLDDFEA